MFNALVRVIDAYIAPPKTPKSDPANARVHEPLLADARKEAAAAAFKAAAEADGRSGGIKQMSMLAAGVGGIFLLQALVVGMLFDGDTELRCGLAVIDPDASATYPAYNRCGGTGWTGPTCCYNSLPGQTAASASCAPWDSARSYCIYASPEGVACGGAAWTGPTGCALGLVCEPTLLTCVRQAAADEVRIAANDPSLRYSGRIDRTDPLRPRLAWSMSSAGVGFTGASLTLVMEETVAGTVSCFDVHVQTDGGVEAVSVLCLSGSGVRSYVVADGTLGAGIHQLWLVKRTEPAATAYAATSNGAPGATVFHGLILALGAAVSVPLPRWGSRRIELVGSSTEIGYGVDGTFPCSFTAQTENGAESWAAYLAAALNAELVVLGWSGKGLVRNYDEKATTSAKPLPTYYELTVPSATTAWNFSANPVDAVIVNLGTNDYAIGQEVYHPPAQTFIDAYKAFVLQIKAKYPMAVVTRHAKTQALAPSSDMHSLSCPPLLSPCFTARAPPKVKNRRLGL